MDINFQNRLIKLRELFNLSGYSFAKKLEIPQPTYSRYESGEQKPSGKLLESLVLKFNVNIYWLFTGEGEMFLDFKKNSGERHYDTTIELRLNGFGTRLSALQAKHNFLDSEMARLLKITEQHYGEIVNNKQKPSLEILNNLKENFKVDIDEMLYGVPDFKQENFTI